MPIPAALPRSGTDFLAVSATSNCCRWSRAILVSPHPPLILFILSSIQELKKDLERETLAASSETSPLLRRINSSCLLGAMSSYGKRTKWAGILLDSVFCLFPIQVRFPFSMLPHSNWVGYPVPNSVSLRTLEARTLWSSTYNTIS